MLATSFRPAAHDAREYIPFGPFMDAAYVYFRLV